MRGIARSAHASLVVLLGAASAYAQTKEPVRLVWASDAAATEACASAEVVRSDVSSRLGFWPFTEEEPRAPVLEVAVTRSRSAWSAQIALRAADGALRGSRRVESRAADCGSLTSATALAIALMIDPQLLARDVPPEPAAPAEPAPVPPQPRAEPARPTAEELGERARSHGALAASGVLALGVLPRPALGAALRGELVLHRELLVSVEAVYLAEQRVPRAGVESAFGLSYVAAGPCYRKEVGSRWALASCASVLLGALTVSVASLEPVDAGAHSWLAAACGLRLAYRAGHVVIEASTSVLANLKRREYVVERLEPVRTQPLYREPAVGMLGGLSAGVAF